MGFFTKRKEEKKKILDATFARLRDQVQLSNSNLSRIYDKNASLDEVPEILEKNLEFTQQINFTAHEIAAIKKKPPEMVAKINSILNERDVLQRDMYGFAICFDKLEKFRAKIEKDFESDNITEYKKSFFDLYDYYRSVKKEYEKFPLIKKKYKKIKEDLKYTMENLTAAEKGKLELISSIEEKNLRKKEIIKKREKVIVASVEKYASSCKTATSYEKFEKTFKKLYETIIKIKINGTAVISKASSDQTKNDIVSAVAEVTQNKKMLSEIYNRDEETAFRKKINEILSRCDNKASRSLARLFPE
ncbi:MAG: hypothetical protein LBK29_02035 [Oscillospiraceae bacterium]|jgi:hypothetical protein|nr:hypothetical protein [Oscillospiraceae bacterium]